MAHELLYRHQIHASIEQIAGERAADVMGVNAPIPASSLINKLVKEV